MIFLILKIALYLLLATIAGGAAGWVLRHLAAARQEEEMQRTLADARARVPQFESLIRSRDEQINRLKDELKDKDVRINGLVEGVREAENSFRDKDRELKQFTAQHETLELVDGTGEADQPALMGGEPLDFGQEDTAIDEAGTSKEVQTETLTTDASTDASVDVDRLLVEIARLERDLNGARAEAADATAEAAVTEAEVITLKAELQRAGGVNSDSNDSGSAEEIAELQARLKQKALEYERLRNDLEHEQRRVLELERERELQNKSLQVLHQQLELERERGQRVVSG